MANIKFTNTVTSALIDAAIASRNADTAAMAFDLKVAAFYTEIKGRVADLPAPVKGAVQPADWKAFATRWIEAYLEPADLDVWRRLQGSAKNRLQNRAVQALNRFRKALSDLADKGVTVSKNATAEQVKAAADAAAPKGKRESVPLKDSIQKVLNDQIKRVKADLDKGKEKRVLRGHAEIVAALTQAHDLLNPSK